MGGGGIPNGLDIAAKRGSDEMTASDWSIDLLAILGKNQNRTMLRCNFKNFRMCIIVIEPLTPLDRASCINLYKNNARSRLFCRMAKRSILAENAI